MQERAIRTRRAILFAAAKTFEEHGFQAATITDILAAANVTKGALYFHFQSKEELAEGVLREQGEQLVVPDRPCKVQQLVDVVMLHAFRLQNDCMVRAGVRLTLDQRAGEIDRSGAFLRWAETCQYLLERARQQGEVLPHVKTGESAGVLVGAFAGIQAMSQATSDYTDLMTRVVALLRHLLPSVVHSAVLAAVDLSESRGAAVFAEVSGQHLGPEVASEQHLGREVVCEQQLGREDLTDIRAS